MRHVKILETTAVREFREGLSCLASTDAAVFAKGGTVRTERDKGNGQILEDFRFCNSSVCPIKYTKFDYKSKRPRAISALTKKIRQRMDAQVGAPRPRLELIQRFMAKIL